MFVPSIICVLLALQVCETRSIFLTMADTEKWGGTMYAWDSGRIIALFTVFGITLLAFIGVQIWLGESATSKLLSKLE